jgi:hypothetical protein
VEVICLEDKAFYALIDRVVDRIKEKDNIQEDKWIPADKAMHLLNITSKTTLQKLRDEGRVRFTQPSRKLILYDRDSILAYLDAQARETF